MRRASLPVLAVATLTLAACDSAPPPTSASAAPAGEACDRSAATRTAPAAFYDALVAEVAGGDEATAAVDDFVAAVRHAGGTPLVDSATDRVVFVRRGEPAGALSVAGTWNGWVPGVLPMERVGRTDLFAAEATLESIERYEYRLVDGGAFLEDPLAQNVAWDGVDHEAEGEMNGVVYPESGDPTAGRLVAWRGVRGAATGDDRDVFVYLPSAYDAPSCPRLPVIELHDGNELLTRAPFQEAADATYAASPEASAVLVFVGVPRGADRDAEYSFGPGTRGDAYVRFLQEDLRPLEDRRLRLCPAAADRGLAGVSLGGLISAYAALGSPHAWGWVGAQSGSFWWDDSSLVARVARGPKVDVRFHIDHGCPDDNCGSNLAFAHALAKRGYDFEYDQEPGGQHGLAYWQKRFPALLRHFRKGRTGCAR